MPDEATSDDYRQQRLAKVFDGIRDLVWEVTRLHPLTGMRNQSGFDLDLAEAETPLSLISVEVNRFKSINSMYGPAQADTILREVGRRLRDIAGDRMLGTAYHLHGDEFAVLLPEVSRYAMLAAATAARVRVNEEPFYVRGESSDRELPPGEVSVAVAAAHITDSLDLEARRRVWKELNELTEYQKLRGLEVRVLVLGEDTKQPDYATVVEAIHGAERHRFLCSDCLPNGNVNLPAGAEHCARCGDYFSRELARATG